MIIYTMKIILVSVLFIAITLFSFNLLGGHFTWLEASVTIAVFVVADAVILIFTGRPQKSTSHADTPKSTH